MISKKRIFVYAAFISFIAIGLSAQDSRTQAQAPIINQSPFHFGSSPFDPPDKNDKTFTVDTGSGLDTGCTFRSGGPLIIHVSVDRVVGDVAKLKAKGLISPTARLEMPAFDVDFNTPVPPPFQPERDRVTFNGHVVPGEFLTGLDNTWIMNRYDVPIEWVNFPDDPGHGGTLTPSDNTIQIDIDTANADELWCTSIDWAALSIEVARPVVMAHGILSSGATWSSTWVPNLNDAGIPNSNALNMGNLDSIGNNAAKIADEVASSRQRWGVDKVNIVAHSKGGIDSRDYVETSSSVDQLIQIGTPNAGSPLADLVQAGLLGGTGLVGSVIVNSLAGPAGVQLTQPYMAVYNLTHGSNSDVAYTSLAGSYHPRLLLDPIDSLLTAIVGPGDTIVPVTSVFALPYSSHLLFESSGADTQATHTQQTSSQGIYSALSPLVQRLAQLSSNPPAPLRTATIIKNIAQGAVQSTTVPVDQATPVTFGLMFPSGDLELSLISPSGQTFSAGNISGNPNVTQQKKAILGGFFEIFRIANPETGNWTLRVTANSVTDPSGTVAYSLTAWLENAIVALVGSMEKSSLHAGDNLHLLATLTTGGLPLPGATVTGRVLLPDGSTLDVTLHDDGTAGDSVANDGVYSAFVGPFFQPGNYQILFRAGGTTPGAPASFSREDYAIATVSASSSSFNGSFQDAGLDTDGDGLFNQLNINAGVNVTTAATYRIVATLTDSGGNSLDAAFKAALTPGLTTVRLTFDGSTIFKRGINGPYKLSHIILAEENGSNFMPVDERSNAFQTAAYSFTAFQHPPLFLTGNNSAVGIDTDNNGLFNQLVASIDVNVRTSGFYRWSARLADINGAEIALAGNFGNLNAGVSTVNLTFPGQLIGQHGVNGPYKVDDLVLFGPGGSITVPNVFLTPAFLATQFEGSQNINHPPVAVAGANQSVECSAQNGTRVTLDGSASSDPDGDPLTFIWRDGSGNVVGTSAVVQVFAPLGTATYTLTVNDGRGGSSTASVSITVVDTVPPVITLPSRTFTAIVPLVPAPRNVLGLPAPTVVDVCDPSPVVTDDAPARFLTGSQTITFTATDASGNAAQAQLAVEVLLRFQSLSVETTPHDNASQEMKFTAIFQLGPGNNGVDPAKDILSFSGPGGVSFKVPLSAFQGGSDPLNFSGDLNGLHTVINFKPLGTDVFRADIKVNGVVGVIAGPAPVELRIGDDIGQAVINVTP